MDDLMEAKPSKTPKKRYYKITYISHSDEPKSLLLPFQNEKEAEQFMENQGKAKPNTIEVEFSHWGV